jgi:hypothetical protein
MWTTMRSGNARRGARRIFVIVGLGAYWLTTGCSGSVVGQGGGAGADGGEGGLPMDCVDMFHGGTPAVCCPDPAPDCSKEPDGYPGYLCIDKGNQFCSCACGGGMWACGC